MTYRACSSFILALLVGATLPHGQIRADNITPELARKTVEEIRSSVEQLRGLDFKRDVRVEVVDDAAAQAHVERRVDQFEIEDQIDVTTRAYRLLGLVESEVNVMDTMLDTLREQAGGFYDPTQETFYLLDDMPESMIQVLAAHELTHALEDQHYDLDERLERVIENDDRAFALTSIHEGSATLVMSFFAARSILRGEMSAEALEQFGEEFGNANMVEDLPPAILRQLLGPYVLGMHFLVRGNMTATMLQGFPVGDVNDAHRDAPQSSEQILHPEKYWDPDLRDQPIPVEMPDVAQALGRRWSRVGDGVLGELILALLVGAETPSDQAVLSTEGGAAWTNRAASGWGGDRWELWQRGKDEVLVLSTVWDTRQDAKEFTEALTPSKNLRWRRTDDRVLLVVGRGGRRATRLLDSLAAGN